LKNVKKMGGARSTYGGQVRAGFWWGELRERGHLEHLCVDRRMILKLSFKEISWGGGGVD
jgi:hypothetical protein